MKTARRPRNLRRLLGYAAAGAILSTVALIACSNSGEGDRCEFLNGNDDCQDGLVCTPASQFTNAGGSNTDRCCPADRNQATVPICKLNTVGGAGDGGPTTDSGPTPLPDSGSDAASDASSDADAADAADADGG
ncbi:hypothetical protein AKJ09_09883 [Labilithrix luteola]|uniref:Lipoprotein n=1 Tax=Labilithrix luteola TaxID=1391654 RepID=A0A0K1QCT4_9BACT|nr:hypothetical protein [Labilithrix luteola]AKV03220.1 hypothetical protein AKJ09_09883 [Labilithrix luteola]